MARILKVESLNLNQIYFDLTHSLHLTHSLPHPKQRQSFKFFGNLEFNYRNVVTWNSIQTQGNFMFPKQIRESPRKSGNHVSIRDTRQSSGFNILEHFPPYKSPLGIPSLKETAPTGVGGGALHLLILAIEQAL